MRGLENEFKNSYCYIDSSYLPADCNLKLEKIAHGVHTDDTLLSDSRTYYRLTPVQNHEPQVGNFFLSDLREIRNHYVLAPNIVLSQIFVESNLPSLPL